MKTVGVLDAKNRLSAKHGRPVATLSPIENAADVASRIRANPASIQPPKKLQK